MPAGRVLLIFTAAALLELLPLAVAHGEGSHGPDSKPVMAEAPSRPVVSDGIDEAAMEPQSYFALSDHSGVMYAHIFLMILAWVVVLPVGRCRVKAPGKRRIS